MGFMSGFTYRVDPGKSEGESERHIKTKFGIGQPDFLKKISLKRGLSPLPLEIHPGCTFYTILLLVGQNCDHHLGCVLITTNSIK